MLDGPAAEMLAPPSGMKIQRSGGALRIVEDGGAFKKQDGKTFFEKQSHSPPRKLDEGTNFSRLPPEVLEDSRQFTPNKDDVVAQQLVEELMKQTAPPVTPAENPQPLKTMIDGKDPTIPGEVAGSKYNKDILWNWSKADIDNFIKNFSDKIKTFGKNAWYYMSGSFIWDRGSKPT